MLETFEKKLNLSDAILTISFDKSENRFEQYEKTIYFNNFLNNDLNRKIISKVTQNF